MSARCFTAFRLLILLFALSLPVGAQESFQDVIEMSVEVGFDSFFRPGFWTPVRVELKNNGESLLGRLIIRPETSGTVVGNAFSAPIDLPSGAEKSATIHIQARSSPDSIRVELLDSAGNARATRDAALFDVQPFDQMVAVVIGANTLAPNLSGLRIGGSKAEQAIWQAQEIPEDAQALAALDVMLLIDIDSQSLSAEQQLALRRWLQAGGHLIVSGGPTARRGTSGLMDILPMRPEGSRALEDMSAYARFSGDSSSQLNERGIIVTGALHEDAQALVEQDGLPLLARRAIGAGLVDMLAADVSLEPLASWAGINQLWLKMLATREPHPAWLSGFTRPEWGAEAVANLPGVDLLPPIQALCIFLALYIVLIGPLNFFILSRINRTGWGWFTIPVVIVVFTGIAWTVGFSLRGGEIIVSRLSVVKTYADVAEAQVDQYFGLLSPRRATYSLEAPRDDFLAVAGATTPSSIFASNTIQTSTEIWQGASFAARDFTIDGGIFANFTLNGFVPRPDIEGSFTLGFDIQEDGRMVGAYQGVINNRSDITLRNAVILGPQFHFALPEDFEPGDIVALDAGSLRANIGSHPAQPNPLELHMSSLAMGLSPFAGVDQNATMRQIQGERYLRSRAFLAARSAAERQAAREQSFLASFVFDQYESTARGTGLYLAGWSDSWPRDLEISGASWGSVDTTLYLIELEVEINLPSQTATLTSEHFSWFALSREGMDHQGTESFNLYEGQAVEFLLHPLPGLEMDVVERLFIEVDRGGGYAQQLDIELYNWLTDEYDVYDYRDGDELEFDEPERYIGAGNLVRMRLEYGQGIGTARVRRVRIEQTGNYD